LEANTRATPIFSLHGTTPTAAWTSALTQTAKWTTDFGSTDEAGGQLPYKTMEKSLLQDTAPTVFRWRFAVARYNTNGAWMPV